MTCAPSEDSDQLGHPPSLIRVSAVRMNKHWALNYILSAQWRLWSDWADAQADLSLRWPHMSFCWFCRAAVLSCGVSFMLFHDRSNNLTLWMESQFLWLLEPGIFIWLNEKNFGGSTGLIVRFRDPKAFSWTLLCLKVQFAVWYVIRIWNPFLWALEVHDFCYTREHITLHYYISGTWYFLLDLAN